MPKRLSVDIAFVDDFGVFEVKSSPDLDSVVAGAVSMLQEESSRTNSDCLNGVCFDQGNTACLEINTSPPTTLITCAKINWLCGTAPSQPPPNAPCPTL